MRARRTRATRTLLFGLTAALVATCAAAAGPANAAPQGLVTAGADREAPRADAPVTAVVDGLTAFGYEASRRTAAPDGNRVLSPLSIACAFAMARAGAGGETAAHLDRIFGFPREGAHEAFNALDRQVARAGGPLLNANSLWAAPGLPIGEPFLRTLATQYGAGVRTVDFGSPAAREAIDTWVRQQTAGRIRKLFDRLDPATVLVLANAVYFKADWQLPFMPAAPDGTFTRADGSTVRAALMRQLGTWRYAEGPGWRAVELPYRGGEFAMWVLLPEPSGDPVELLAPATLAAVAGGLRQTLVEVTVPKWEFESTLDLLGVLGELGAGDLSGFSGIHPEVFLGEAVHRATVTVDEKGTEAAAATGLGFPVSAPPRPDVTFRADRPFAYAIVHTPTRTPTFVGTVGDPSA